MFMFTPAIFFLFVRKQTVSSRSLSSLKTGCQAKSVDLDTKSIMLDKPIDSLGDLTSRYGSTVAAEAKLVVKKKAYK